MGCKRIIPCLDIREGRVVKGVNFVNIKDAGDPVEIAAAYNEGGADELVFLDIEATVQNRSIMFEIIKKVAACISIPLTVGGGIRTAGDFENALNAGASKVSVNSASLKNPLLIEEASLRFGSGCIVVAIDAKKRADGLGWNVYTNGGRINTGRDAVMWAKEAEGLGAGEILLTSMDCDGTKKGYDIELTSGISKGVKIPVTASGGAGTMEHFYEVLTEGGADAALAASLFHFGEIEIRNLKKYLKNRNIGVKL